jgi:glutamine amidotransferase
MRVVIFDYGAGNLHSLSKALETAGVEILLEDDPRKAVEGDALVLPGVGAFGAAAERLAPGREIMRTAIRNGLPTMGICLGMQLLFDESEEGDGAGLGIIPGRVTKLRAARVPQIGWNTIEAVGQALRKTSLRMAYYANSFVCRPDCEEIVTAWSTHEGDRFPASVQSGSVIGVQFHPEKSSANGVRFLHDFLDGARNARAFP